MAFNAPKLDDRTFDQLLAEAQRLIAQKGVGWTDLSPGDPGIVLLELFAYLTEVMLYRLNRLPEKVYIEFLRLLGVTIQPPAAATVELTFSRNRPSNEAIEIARGTRVTIARSSGGQESPVFITAEPVVLQPTDKEVNVLAYHAEQVEGELLGLSNGMPGQNFTLQRPPIIASTGDTLDLLVGVEALAHELDERVAVRETPGKVFRLWREVSNFSAIGDDPYVFIADRNSGLVTFAPALRMKTATGDLQEMPTALAAIPAATREVRAWYRRGGGSVGNVNEATLTVLKDSIVGVTVTNRKRATGGKTAETLENALRRGPQEFHSLQRAVTARDFELLARSASARAVERTKAITRASIWKHAIAGHVEVLLAPDLPNEARLHATLDLLKAHENEAVRQQIQRALDERRPLGTTCLVNWAHYKQVTVQANVVVRREDDTATIQQRLLERLQQTITPVSTPFSSNGWPFGQALRASHVYDILLAEPGVRWVDRVRLRVDETPQTKVDALAADYFQPHTWYAGSDHVLFRSLNNGEGWEVVERMEGEIIAIEPHPQRPGMLAIAAKNANGSGTQVCISADCGESWALGRFTLAFSVNELAWILRNGTPVLFLATDVGLYEIVVQNTPTPTQIQVDPNLPAERGFYTVATHTSTSGIVTVAVAAQNLGGVYLSLEGGNARTFRKKSTNMPASEDVRVLEFEDTSPNAYLWAGVNALEGNPGNGCYRWQLRGTQDPPEGWVNFQKGWQGGSCRGLTVQQKIVYAASHRLGVLSLDTSQQEKAEWQAPSVSCGLPMRDPGRFQPINVVASQLEGGKPLVMAGSVAGIHASTDQGGTYNLVSNSEFIEKVTLPETWLFVSGDHLLTIKSEDEAR